MNHNETRAGLDGTVVNGATYFALSIDILTARHAFNGRFGRCLPSETGLERIAYWYRWPRQGSGEIRGRFTVSTEDHGWNHIGISYRIHVGRPTAYKFICRSCRKHTNILCTPIISGREIAFACLDCHPSFLDGTIIWPDPPSEAASKGGVR